MNKLIILLLLICIVNPIFAQDKGNGFRDQYQYHIKRTQEDMKVDGVLNEAVWQSAQIATNFFYITPVDNKAVEKEDQTEVMMTYDDRNIYLAAICHGKKPYLLTSLKRDDGSFWDGEAFMVSFDPGNERTNGYGFATNSAQGSM